MPAYYSVKKFKEPVEIDRSKIMQEMGREKLTALYRNMARTRAFDDKIEDMLKKGVSIIQHSTRGQEATPIAACLTLNENDYLMPYHRGWAWGIGKGMDPARMLAEITYKKTGYCKGKGGPHLGDYQLGVLGRPGIQGAHLSIAAGVGLSSKLRKSKQACLCFFGDGASNSPSFHEALNLVSVWKAPVVYICENNQYALYSTKDEVRSVEDVADRAHGYDMEGIIVDGNDAVAVYQVVKEAVERAKNGLGPSLIEAKTYRQMGHTGLDTLHYGGYRPKEEVDEWKKKCPLDRLCKELLEEGYLTQEEINKIHEEAKEEMNRAEKFAEESPYPEREDYFTDNLVDEAIGGC